MLALILFAAVAVGSLGIAAYAYVIDQRRRAILGRTLAGAAAPVAPLAGRLAMLVAASGGTSRFVAGAPKTDRGRVRLTRLVPASWLEDEATRVRLVRAGLDADRAMPILAAARLSLLVALPLPAFLLALGRPGGEMLLVVAGALAAAWIAPRAYVDNRVRRRQERIRRAVPDALDLLLVCVEAGVSLEGAMLRVSREMATLHPDLTEELALLLRRTKAGVSREEALRGLWLRTGVEELRTLASNIRQSERWGTSIVRMLRVTAQTLRRKRRQAAEKKASTAPLKMTLPLVVLILPALFAVLLGPSAIAIWETIAGGP